MKFRRLLAILGATLFAGGVAHAQGQERDIANLEVVAPAKLRAMIANKLSMKRGPMRRIGPDLTELYLEHQSYLRRGLTRSSGNAFAPSNPLLRLQGGRINIEAIAAGNPADLLADLQALGAEHVAMVGRHVSGSLPIQALDKLTRTANLAFARPVMAGRRVGLVTSQGDAAMNSDDLRAQKGVDGTGVKVGVLSDSFDCLGGAAADVASGDLPSNIMVLDDLTGVDCAGAIDEGRGMMQLIFDVAPGADLSFHTAFRSEADFADGIVEWPGPART